MKSCVLGIENLERRDFLSALVIPDQLELGPMIVPAVFTQPPLVRRAAVPSFLVDPQAADIVLEQGTWQKE